MTNVLENSNLTELEKNLKINAGYICCNQKKITIRSTGVSGRLRSEMAVKSTFSKGRGFAALKKYLSSAFQIYQ